MDWREREGLSILDRLDAFFEDPDAFDDITDVQDLLQDARAMIAKLRERA